MPERIAAVMEEEVFCLLVIERYTFFQNFDIP